MKKSYPSAKGRLLLLCYFDPHGISTVIDNIMYLRNLSGYAIDVFNYFNLGPVKICPDVDWSLYDGLIIHNTLSYSPDTLEGLDSEVPGGLASFPGAKILFKQDEHHLAGRIAKYIGSREFDLVFTILEPTEWPKVYPASKIGGARMVQMLTGYVMPWMRSMKVPSDSRPIDIGYRGSIQPFIFGRLAYEKRQIGDEVLRMAKPLNLRLDVSSRWEDRLGGAAWTTFLSQCKATLAVESGSDLFDFDGEVAVLYEQFKKEEGEHLEDPGWCERALALLAPWEGKVNYRAISPRHFEACATKTLQLMLEGSYNGIFEPYRHYFPLKRDYSNFDEAVKLLRDEQRRGEIADNAYHEIIENKEYWIETFVEKFDRAVGELFECKSLPRSTTGVSFGKPSASNVLLLCAHVPRLDPRIGWITDHAPDGMLIHVCSCDHSQDAPDERFERIETGGLAVAGACYELGGDFRFQDIALLGGSEGVKQALFAIDWIARHKPHDLPEFIGTMVFDRRTSNFHWIATYFARVTETLLRTARRFQGIDAILATDLETLIAACILKQEWNVPLVYDAHEFWPESDVDSLEWEIEFWRGIEEKVLPSVDDAFTVSGPLADHLTTIYRRQFLSVPNCEPLRSSSGTGSHEHREDRTIFLFQGNFSPGRGLQKLVSAWPGTPPDAVLWLRGPNSAYREELQQIVEKTGLLGSRIHFLEPVSESELVSGAAEADVGVIPYEPIISNNKFCCPNKLSQYMAAKLPILSNCLEFVGEKLREADCGLVADFRDREALVRAVTFFCNHPVERRAMGERALLHHTKDFHWEKVSRPLYESLERQICRSRKEEHQGKQSASFTRFSRLHEPGFWGGVPTMVAKTAKALEMQRQLEGLSKERARLNSSLKQMKNIRKALDASCFIAMEKLISLSRSRWAGLGRILGITRKLPSPKRSHPAGYLTILMEVLKSDRWLRFGAVFFGRVGRLLFRDGTRDGRHDKSLDSSASDGSDSA